MASNILSEMITQLSNDPALQPILPFVFVLAVVYGLLSMVDVFKKKSVNFLIALVFAFFAAGYQPFVTSFFINLGIVLWGFLIIFTIAFLLEAIGIRGKKAKRKPDVSVSIAGVVVLLLVTVGFAYMSEINIPIIGTENFMVILGLFLLFFMIYYAYEHGPRQQQAR